MYSPPIIVASCTLDQTTSPPSNVLESWIFGKIDLLGGRFEICQGFSNVLEDSCWRFPVGGFLLEDFSNMLEDFSYVF